MSAETVAHADEVPAWVLTVLVAVGQTVVVALILAVGSGASADQSYGPYLFAACFGALLLFRRELPVGVLALSILGVFIYYAIDYPPIGMALPVVGAFYSAAERGRVLTAALAGAVLLTVSLFFRTSDGESSAVLAYDVITNAALIGCAIALALAVSSRRSLRDQHERMARLERRHQQERTARQLEAERLRIARDVHDSIGHALSLVSVQARVAQQALGKDDDAAVHALDNVVSATGSSLGDLRRTIAMLRTDPDTTDHAPLTLSGISTTAQAARDAGLAVDLLIDVGAAAITASTASTAFRIVQEAITNVLRHAQATAVNVIVRVKDDALYLRVLDDGVGADTRTLVEGRGLAGMRERAALLGGDVRIEAGPSGFTVNAMLPMGDDK
ncbi:sensor histidine kinase [Arthrobacter zhaoguopingii]|uniref:sensor histidine kinase n=1 Tax=Arthrobacter zhaoguopingii TaxID=2681491 RepID=UPI0013567849|nr:sensor histidine kinase [Arthrobacter zhaoguopingii]